MGHRKESYSLCTKHICLFVDVVHRAKSSTIFCVIYFIHISVARIKISIHTIILHMISIFFFHCSDSSSHLFAPFKGWDKCQKRGIFSIQLWYLNLTCGVYITLVKLISHLWRKDITCTNTNLPLQRQIKHSQHIFPTERLGRGVSQHAIKRF